MECNFDFFFFPQVYKSKKWSITSHGAFTSNLCGLVTLISHLFSSLVCYVWAGVKAVNETLVRTKHPERELLKKGGPGPLPVEPCSASFMVRKKTDQPQDFTVANM